MKVVSWLFAEGLEEPCKRKDLGDDAYGFEYYPTTPGTYSITITWGGQHIPRRYAPTLMGPPSHYRHTSLTPPLPLVPSR